IGFVALRRYCQGGTCRSIARLDGKTVIITGANTGIGARVILACRDITKAERAAQNIMKQTQNPNVEVRVLDLASLSSVRSFAENIKKTEDKLNILINNAGGKINFDDINLEKDYNPMEAYRQSKLANVLFTKELSRQLQGTNVTINALHPGVVKTELVRYMPLTIPFFLRWLFIPFKPFLKSPKQGAQTSIYCAVAEELEHVSGKYFSDCAVKEPDACAKDDEAAKRLWTLSEELVGLKKTESSGGTCKSIARLDGKTVIITGANTGIGRETALDLAGRGARVILACRDITKAERAAQNIMKQTQNPNVEIRVLDLASLSSVRSFAEKIKNTEEKLDILINNADLLKKSAPSRIINVSSMAHRGTNVTVNALHPGIVKTERYLPLTIPFFLRLLFIPFKPFLKSPKQGAQTSIYC
ncbi:hypothetical protein KUTeg_013007, partial [Tegillarca granosa]